LNLVVLRLQAGILRRRQQADADIGEGRIDFRQEAIKEAAPLFAFYKALVDTAIAKTGIHRIRISFEEKLLR